MDVYFFLKISLNLQGMRLWCEEENWMWEWFISKPNKLILMYAAHCYTTRNLHVPYRLIVSLLVCGEAKGNKNTPTGSFQERREIFVP